MSENKIVEVTSGRGPNFKVLGRYYRYVEPVIADPLIRGYFEIVLTILFVAVCIFFFIRPTSTTIVQLLRKVDDKNKVDAQLTQKINDLIQAQSNYSKVAPKVVYLDRVLPDKPNVDLLTQDLELICKTNNVSPSNLVVNGTGLTPDAWIKNLGYKEGDAVPLAFSFTVKTDFATAEKLLASLVSSQRLIAIQVTSFSSTKADTTSKAELDTSYSGIAYFLP